MLHSDPAFRTIAIVLQLEAILLGVLNALFLYYIYQLSNRGCKCADDWRRTFMEFSLAVFLIFNVVNIFISPIKMPIFLAVAFVLFSIIYIIIARQFVNRMKREVCDCATHSIVFKTLDYFNMFQIVGLVLGVVILVIAVIVSGTTTSSPPREALTERPVASSSNGKRKRR